MFETEVFNMDKKKKSKRGFALRPSTRTTGLILDVVYNSFGELRLGEMLKAQ